MTILTLCCKLQKHVWFPSSTDALAINMFTSSHPWLSTHCVAIVLHVLCCLLVLNALACGMVRHESIGSLNMLPPPEHQRNMPNHFVMSLAIVHETI